MRRIYAIIGVVLIAGSFWLGHKMGSSSMDQDVPELEVLNRKYDSISAEIAASKKREEWYALQSEKDMKSIDSLSQQIKIRQKNHLQTQQKYGTAIKEVENYSLDRLDSFLIDLYPSPGVRKFRYNSDGSIRHSNETGPEMEVKNDGAARDSVRLAYERISEDMDGQRGFKPYCGKTRAFIDNEGSGIGGAEESALVIGESGFSFESESRILVSQIEGVQIAEEYSDWSRIGIGWDAHLFIH